MKTGWCILHVGTHKTGTTALQRSLLSQQDKLIGQGVLYPLSVLKLGYVAHQPFARALLGDEFRSELPRILQSVDLERAKTGAPNVIISSELLESISRDPLRIQYLRECLDHYFDNIFAVAVTRAPRRYFLSLYKELSRVKSLSWNLSELISPYLNDQRISVPYPKINLTIHHEFNYDLFASNFSEVFGKDSVLFLDYESLCEDGDGDIVGPLVRKVSERFRLSALHELGVRIASGVRVNRSKPLWKAMFQYALNRYQQTDSETRPVEAIDAQFGRDSSEAAAVFHVEKQAAAVLRSLDGLNGDPSMITATLECYTKLIEAEVLIDQLARSRCSSMPVPSGNDLFPC